MMKKTFSTNQIGANHSAVNGQSGTGDSQPPRKKIVVVVLIRMMFAYSPRKNRPNDIDEYSAKKPATSSDSPSGRSKGTRLVSASAEMKKMTAIGASMPNAYQFQK